MFVEVRNGTAKDLLEANEPRKTNLRGSEVIRRLLSLTSLAREIVMETSNAIFSY